MITNFKINKITNEEIKELKKDNKLIEKFLEENKNFLIKIINKYDTSKDSSFKEDLFQEASLALLKCIQKYNPKKNNAKMGFSNFAYRVIDNQVHTYVFHQYNKFFNFNVSIENFIRQSDNNSYNEYIEKDFINKNDSFENKLIQKILFDQIYENLTNLEKRIIELYFIQKLKHKEVAKKIGIKYKTYQIIFYEIIKKKAMKILSEEDLF